MQLLRLLGALAVFSSLLLAILVGCRLGRDAERRRPLSRPEDIARVREETRSRFERELRAKLGLPKPHQGPDDAPKIRKARIRR